MTTLYNMIDKKYPGRVDEYLQRLYSLSPEGTWFKATGNDYAFCMQLVDDFFVAVIKTPIWDKESFKGLRIEFMWTSGLDFER